MTTTPGTRIKELRTLADMSQEELGRRVGVQRAAINKYEKGTVTNIPIHTIEKIANVFNVSPTYLLGWNTKCENELSMEVRTIQGVNKFYGKDCVELLEIFHQINLTGKKRLLQYAEDLFKLYVKE